MTCFKYRAGVEDPVLGTPDERFLSGIWSDRRVGRPETSTIGLTFTRGGYSRYGLGVPRASGGYTVARPDHWAFEGTDLRDGDTFGERDAIVAYEVDGCAFTMQDGRPVPTHEDGSPASLEILATAPARLWSQEEQPTRYAHEPGELEHVATALFGDASPEHVEQVAAQPRRDGGVHAPRRRHRRQRRRDRLDVRTQASATPSWTASPATSSTVSRIPGPMPERPTPGGRGMESR